MCFKLYLLFALKHKWMPSYVTWHWLSWICYIPAIPFFLRVFLFRTAVTIPGTHLGFSEEELKVSATQDAVVLHVAREVHGAGAVHGAVHLHVAVDDVEVFLFVLVKNREIQYV